MLKEKEKTNVEPVETTTVDTSLELLKFTAQVQSRINKDIGSDFVLASLEENTKEGIIELTTDAYFAKRLIARVGRIARKYDFDKENQAWKKRLLNKEELGQLKTNANYVFDAYMNRLFMTVNLNRNVDKNHLLNLLAGNALQDEPEPEFADDNKIKKKIREMVQSGKTDTL